jgi:hypothetical protein
MIRQVQECPAERVCVASQLTNDGVPDRTSGLREVRVLLAISEPSGDTTDRRVDRQHRMVSGKEQHPVGAALAHLRQSL